MPNDRNRTDEQHAGPEGSADDEIRGIAEESGDEFDDEDDLDDEDDVEEEDEEEGEGSL